MTALPLRISPHDGEAWHSYLVRTAEHYRASVTTLADRIDLRRAGRWPGYHGVTLDERISITVAGALNLEPHQIAQMQLTRYDQLAFDLTGLRAPQPHRIAATRRVSQQGWVFLAGSRFCPQCLRTDGIWRTEWRIPWITTCTRHRIWLEHQCPACSGIPGIYNGLHATAPSRTGTRPGNKYCDLPVGAGVCGSDLTRSFPRSAPPEALAFTTQFRDTITSNHGVVAGSRHSSLQTLRAWQAAIGISMSLGRATASVNDRTHRWSSPPRAATTFQHLVTGVAPLIDAPTQEEAATTLLDWCHRAGVTSPHRDTFARATQPAIALKPITDTALEAVGRTHIRIARRRQTATKPLRLFRWAPDDVPQLIWPCALTPGLRSSTRPNHLILRAVAAMILVRMHSGGDWRTSGAVLGIPPDKARNWTRYCFAQSFPELKETLLYTAEDVASLLPTQPAGNAWQLRPKITGFGFHALRHAQAPACRQDDPTRPWCPCTARR